MALIPVLRQMIQRWGKNVDMDASAAVVYASKNSGIVNTLHTFLDKAKSQSDVGTKADIYLVALHIVPH